MSEDLQLTTRVQTGKGVLAPGELLMRTPIMTQGLGHVADQARRWYMLVRIHAPLTYGIALVVTSFNAAGWLLTAYAALTGAVLVLVAAVGLALARTAGRAALVYRLWGRPGLTENRWFLTYDWLVTPLAAVFSAVLAWSALLKRRLTWGGITYEVRGPQDIRIVDRSKPTH
jgi:hypothetical protein